MPIRRRRRPGSDRLYVTSDTGLPLGHLDLPSRTVHDVPTAWAQTFRDEVDGWLFAHGVPPLASDEQIPTGPPPELEAGTPTPAGGWAPADPAAGWAEDHARTADIPASEDLAHHLPSHGLAAEAARARASGVRDADRPHRLRLDGRHAVADALGRLSRTGPGRRRPRWRMLHGITMEFDDGPVLLDHLVVGPAGIFVVEVLNRPGGRVVIGPTTLEVDRERIDMDRRRLVGEEAEDRIAESLAIAAGAERTLNPPTVTPVVAVVGAVVVGHERPRGVLVSRVGQLPRILQAFGTPLNDLAVEQIFSVARQAVTWTR